VLAVADARGKYGNVRQGKHYYRLDVGIAMAHFFLAAREMRWTGTWDATGRLERRAADAEYQASCGGTC